jgi:hypothetical protein
MAATLMEREHPLSPRVPPVPNVLQLQARTPNGPTERIDVVVVRIAVEIRGLWWAIRSRPVKRLDAACAPLILEDRRIEDAARAKDLIDIDETAHHTVQPDVREDGDCDTDVERSSKGRQVEVCHLSEDHVLVGNAIPRKLDVSSCVQQLSASIYSIVVPSMEVADQVDAAPQTPASHVNHVVLRTEPTRPQEAKLKPPELVPEAADRRAVPVRLGAVPQFLLVVR